MKTLYLLRSFIPLALFVLPLSPLMAQTTDTDGDGMPDAWESAFGLDPNSSVDASDDPDYDGLANLAEFNGDTRPDLTDTDFDGIDDSLDLYPADPSRALDSDSDGLPDAWELAHGLDPMLASDANDLFHDGDSLTVIQEYNLGTDHRREDSDRDGIADDADPFPLDENYRADSDADGMPDAFELRYFFLDDLWPNDATLDFDYDGLSNLEEFLAGTDPSEPDTDGDYELDGSDVFPRDSRYWFDSDNDGMPDNWEFGVGLYPYEDDSWGDLDGDYSSNLQEFLDGTDPQIWDTDQDGEVDGYDRYPTLPHYTYDLDRDGIPDEYEFYYGFSSSNASDAAEDQDYDGLTNLEEFKAGTWPLFPDSDFDGEMDGMDLYPLDPAYALDSDSDGIPDAWEVINAYDPFYFYDLEYDEDGDLLTTREEFQCGLNPRKADTDHDGVDDGIDAFPLQHRYSNDSDSDGIPDRYEYYADLDPYWAGDAHEDRDYDGLSNLEEFLSGAGLDNFDSDNDGWPDGDDVAPVDPRYALDHDQDGLPDEWEDRNGGDAFAADVFWEDPDYDLVPNRVEYRLGTHGLEWDSDNDGVGDDVDRFPLNPSFRFDTDRDAIPDIVEQQVNFNPYDINDGGLDWDGDGLTNSQEFLAGTSMLRFDSDADYVADAEDLFPLDPAATADSDFDGLPDEWEMANGLDPLSAHDAEESHHDLDELSVIQEYRLGTNYLVADTDGDGIYDGQDKFPLDGRYSADFDGDGMPDQYEAEHGLSIHDASDAGEDLDMDGLSNRDEFHAGASPSNPDSDMDGVSDGEDPVPADPKYVFDADGDGLPYRWEVKNQTDPNRNDAWEDFDGDQLTNIEEFQLGTRAYMLDTDGDSAPDAYDRYPLDPQYQMDRDHDGMPDAYEHLYGLSPYDGFDAADDFDGDGLNNLHEFRAGTRPDLTDSDFDGYNDGGDAYGTDPRYTMDYDQDGLPDVWEILNGFDPNYDDANEVHHDGDSLSVLDEYRLGTNPRNSDTDGDGSFDDVDAFPLDNRYQLDDDADGMPNAYEMQNGLWPHEWSAWDDADNDGLENINEFLTGADPNAPDSDADGVFDGQDVSPMDPNYRDDLDRDGLPDEWEVIMGMNPSFSADAWEDLDGDWISNRHEYLAGTDAQLPDTDGDGIGDGPDRFPLDARYTVDRDFDGMPVEWENQAGLSDANIMDALDDRDGDGVTNLQEFIDSLSQSTFVFTQGENVGYHEAPGSFFYDEGTDAYSMEASGFNLGGWVDSFYFVYELVQGDVDIQVRLSSIANNWAAGGIMIRDSLDVGSPFAANVVQKMDSGYYLRRLEEYTPEPGIVSSAQEGDWLRLQKQGNVITHSISFDGETWHVMGSDNYVLGEEFYIGLVGVTEEMSPTTTILFEGVEVGLYP